jgi:hypothetical protein
LRHLTQRVAWHENAWDGTVCGHPRENAFCLALDRIHEERDDERQELVAGEHWADLADGDLPPCKAESGAFMTERGWTREVKHPYQNSDKAAATHGHLRPTTISVPPHSTFSVPFNRMLVENTEAYADALGLALPPEQQAPFETAWVFSRRRQEVLLDSFFDAFTPTRSLVFFYTKEGHPLGDSIRRLLVGVGQITKVGPRMEYESVGSKAVHPIWDRIVCHSIRSDNAEGVLLPYHAYLTPTGDPDEDERRQRWLAEITVAPDPAHIRTFSYFSEHASPDVALSTLVRSLDAVQAVIRHGVARGPWAGREEWLNAQIAATWEDRGAFPGLGSALEALGLRMGTALALELITSGAVDADADPWPVVEGLLDGRVEAPRPVYRPDLAAVHGTWNKLTEERRRVLRLLSRFALSPEQATRWFDERKRRELPERLSDGDILANPYRIAEADVPPVGESAVSIGAVDRGLLPEATIAARFPVESPGRVESPSDRRRVRGAVVSVLRRAAEEGDTLLSALEALTRIERLDLQRECSVPLDWFAGNEEFLSGAVEPAALDLPDGERLAALQLTTYKQLEKNVPRTLLRRAARPLPSTGADWRDLLIKAIEKTGTKVDLSKARHREALAEQEQALETITTHKLGVLVGRAGTGKTSVLGALVSCPQIKQDGVLLLAPTGKARVRLQRATGGAQASTIAQFLYRLGRYDGARQRPLFTGTDQHRRERTVVIDECSMLTLDDLYAVLQALDLNHVQRLILVGDPNQLPPIGAGRPFADLVGVLDQPSRPEEVTAADVRARLTVEVRTTLGGPSDALRLAAWFTSEPQPKDADRVLSELEFGGTFNDLEILTWRTPEELRLRIVEQLRRQLGAADTTGFDAALGIDADGLIDFAAPDAVERFQILSPVRMHAHGVHDLNRWLQKTFRRRGRGVGDEQIGRKDKVIQLRNEKRKGWSREEGRHDVYLANGEIGMVFKGREGRLDVLFAGRPHVSFRYGGGAFSEDSAPLELAYALTVHKAQGSDFGIVFFVLPKTRLLSRELLYTGLTRSKEKLVLLVEGEDTSSLYELTKPSRSETARRNSNLFRSAVRRDHDQTPYAEHLIHRLADGRMVRSKSEFAIALELQKLGLWERCKYERHYDGEVEPGRRWPDFTFIDAGGELILWEHLGMLDKESYREAWEGKFAWYQANGFVLGETLFTTRDDERGGLDQTAITAVAREIEELL